MAQKNDWWNRQFTEGIKEIARTYNRFHLTKDIEDFDRAYLLSEELNEAYEMSLNLLEFVEFGRALLTTHTLPQTLE